MINSFYAIIIAAISIILVRVIAKGTKSDDRLKKLNRELEKKVKDCTNELANSEAKLTDNLNKLEQTVAEKTVELEEKVSDLEKLNKFMVGRELRMIELKENNKQLQIALEHALRSRVSRKIKKPTT